MEINQNAPVYVLRTVSDYILIASFEYNKDVINGICGCFIRFNSNRVDELSSFIAILNKLELGFSITDTNTRYVEITLEDGYRIRLDSNNNTKYFRICKRDKRFVYLPEWSNATVPLPNFTLDNKPHKKSRNKVIAVISL